MKWIRQGRKIMIIYYEDLRSTKLANELSNIADFMNLKIDQQRLDCTLMHQEGNFLRKKSCYDIQSKPKGRKTGYIYSSQHLVWMNNAIRNVRQETLKRGFRKLPSYEDSNIQLSFCSCNE